MSDSKVTIERGDGCGWLVFCVILACFLFMGEPDIQDLTIKALQKYAEAKP